MDMWKRCKEYAAHMTGLCAVPCSVLDSRAQTFVHADQLWCAHCRHGRCSYLQTHLYGSSEAYRWNGKYIYYCPLGLVFAASSISGEEGGMLGALIAGPMVMGDLQDTLAELPEPAMEEEVEQLPLVATAWVNHLSEILAATTAFACGRLHSTAGTFVYEQEKLLSTLYEVKDRLPQVQTSSQYLIDGEKQLRKRMLKRDKNGAQELLNELLGHIYFSNDFHLDQIKARVVELVVLLSRATIEAGADINEILLCNTSYIKELEQFTSIEELSVWVTGIMHRFISYTFDFTQVKHSNVVYKVMDYVRAHYDEKISLDDIAQHVYLSRTYLSSIFKEETGQSLFSYINSVRVDKSKRFLLDNSIRLVDIAGLCGFEDQSYYTKVFKRMTGVSPKKFRDSHGKTDE